RFIAGARSWKRLPSGESATKRHTEWRVGRDQLVARADRREHRAPLLDHLGYRLSIGSADIGDARGDLELTLRIDEDGFAARRQVPLRRIHEMEHRDVVADRPQSTHR